MTKSIKENPKWKQVGMRAAGPKPHGRPSIGKGEFGWVQPFDTKTVASDEWRTNSRFLMGTTEEDSRFAPKTSRRTSQSFTTNSWQCQGMLPSRRVKEKRDFSLRGPTASQERSGKKKSARSVRNDGRNSAAWAAYSA